MIDSDIVFNKTALGTDEILRRTVGLPSDLRSLLLLIDGRRNVQALRSISIAVRESEAPLLFLEDNGFIERIGGSSVVPITQRRPVAPIAPPAPQAYPTNSAAPAYAPRPVQPQPVPMQPQPAQPAMQPYPQQQQYVPQSVVLGDIKGALIQFVSTTLGSDAGHAIGRIQGARDLPELQAVARRIYEVLKEYSGVRVAEKFMQQFEGILQLR